MFYVFVFLFYIFFEIFCYGYFLPPCIVVVLGLKAAGSGCAKMGVSSNIFQSSPELFENKKEEFLEDFVLGFFSSIFLFP